MYTYYHYLPLIAGLFVVSVRIVVVVEGGIHKGTFEMPRYRSRW